MHIKKFMVCMFASCYGYFLDFVCFYAFSKIQGSTNKQWELKIWISLSNQLFMFQWKILSTQKLNKNENHKKAATITTYLDRQFFQINFCPVKNSSLSNSIAGFEIDVDIRIWQD